MLLIKRDDLARNLRAYGEIAASNQVSYMCPEQYQRVGELGFQLALKGLPLLKAACLASIEVLEGQPRELKRKRRVWADAPAVPTEPDPKFAAIVERFEAYSRGDSIRSEEIFDGVSRALQSVLPGFKYYRSRRHFRKAFADGTAFIGLERGHSMFALRFGVLHRGVEQAREKLFPSDWKSPVLIPATISKFTYNMGPRNPRWKYPKEATWPIIGSKGLERASYEITDFVKEIVLPYVTLHEEPAAVRDTLLTNPGHSDGLARHPWTTVFAIDYLRNRRDWLDDDYRHFLERRSALKAAQTSAESAVPSGDVPSGMMIMQISGSHIKQDATDILAQDYECAAAKWGE